MYGHNWILREIVRSRAVPLLNSRSLFSKDTHILGDSKPLAGAYMDGWPTLIPFLFWPMSHRGHSGYCLIVSPSWSNTSIPLFPCVAPEIALKYRVIFSFYLRRLPHVGGGRTMGRRWPAGSIQHNWVLQSETSCSECGTYGVIAFDEDFISFYWQIHLRSLSLHRRHLTPDSLFHCKVI